MTYTRCFAVLKSGGRYMSRLPTLFRKAGEWTKDINQAHLFEGSFSDYDKEGQHVDFSGGWCDDSPLEKTLSKFRRRVPPAMVPQVVLLGSLKEELNMGTRVEGLLPEEVRHG